MPIDETNTPAAGPTAWANWLQKRVLVATTYQAPGASENAKVIGRLTSATDDFIEVEQDPGPMGHRGVVRLRWPWVYGRATPSTLPSMIEDARRN
jgi:hypothetical protein